MFSLLRGAPSRSPTTVPLFPLKTVLFPGGVLPLKVFEQRYIQMTKACLKDEKPFGVCLLKDGEVLVEVRPFNDRQLNRDLRVLCEQVAAAHPHVPDGRRLCFRE